MIKTQVANSDSMDLNVSATAALSCTFKGVSPARVLAGCFGLSQCGHVEKALVSDGVDNFNNDKTMFLLSRVFGTDTIVFEIHKNGVKVADATAAHGTFYDFGSLANPDLKGILIDWYKVKNLFGYGKYNIVTKHTSLGEDIEIESHCFQVAEYSECIADGTVKIESNLSGCINEYLDLGNSIIYQSTRIRGAFVEDLPEFEKTDYQKANGEKHNVKATFSKKYKLITRLLIPEVFDYLHLNHFLANAIYITNYNTRKVGTFIDLPVAFEGVPRYGTHKDVGANNYVYEFTDKNEKYTKQNSCC